MCRRSAWAPASSKANWASASQLAPGARRINTRGVAIARSFTNHKEHEGHEVQASLVSFVFFVVSFLDLNASNLDVAEFGADVERVVRRLVVGGLRFLTVDLDGDLVAGGDQVE